MAANRLTAALAFNTRRQGDRLSARIMKMTPHESEESVATLHPAAVMRHHFFSEDHPHLVSLISGLMSGLGVAFTVEWNEHFEAARNVPLWETILVASVSCTVAMWVTFFTLNTIHKIRSRG
jgi:hypothetical protein